MSVVTGLVSQLSGICEELQEHPANWLADGKTVFGSTGFLITARRTQHQVSSPSICTLVSSEKKKISIVFLLFFPPPQDPELHHLVVNEMALTLTAALVKLTQHSTFPHWLFYHLGHEVVTNALQESRTSCSAVLPLLKISGWLKSPIRTSAVDPDHVCSTFWLAWAILPWATYKACNIVNVYMCNITFTCIYRFD